MDDEYSCLDKHKVQHTAMFAMANALYRGASIAEDARQGLSCAEAMSMMQKNLGMMQKKKKRWATVAGSQYNAQFSCFSICPLLCSFVVFLVVVVVMR